MLFLGAGIFALAQDRKVGFIVVLFLVSLVHTSPIILQQSPCTLYIQQQICMQDDKGGEEKERVYNEILSRLAYIRNETVEEIKTHAFAHHDTQDFDFVFVGWEGIVGDDVLFCS
jgi:hypothetical protein